jgi:hypothetical protein
MMNYLMTDELGQYLDILVRDIFIQKGTFRDICFNFGVTREIRKLSNDSRLDPKDVLVWVRAIVFFLCLSGLTLLKLKTTVPKGRSNSLEAKYWRLPINHFHGGPQKVDG